MHLVWWFLVVVVVFFSGCSGSEKSASEIRFPYQWLGEQGYGGDIDQQGFIEPSGICFHPVRNTLFVVSDEGWITEIKTDGTPCFTEPLAGDLEGVTVDPSTGLVYVLIEGDEIILEYDPNEKRVLRRFTINRDYLGNENFLQKQTESFDNGCESIAFVADPGDPEGGVFYVGNQWDPPCIIEVRLPLRSSKADEAEGRIVRVLPVELDDPAAMYFDSEKQTLNIVSDADNILLEVTREGKVTQCYAFLGDNQEGIAKDNDGFLYIAQDSGGILKVKDLR